MKPKQIICFALLFLLLPLYALDYTYYRSEETNGLCENLYDIAIDSSGNIWVGSRPTHVHPDSLPDLQGGVSMFDGRDWYRWETSNTDSQFCDDKTFDIEVDADGRVWVSTGYWSHLYGIDNAVLCYYDDYNWHYYGSDSGFDGKVCRDIEFDSEGGMWVGSGEGAGRFGDEQALWYYNGIGWYAYRHTIGGFHGGGGSSHTYAIDDEDNIWYSKSNTNTLNSFNTDYDMTEYVLDTTGKVSWPDGDGEMQVEEIKYYDDKLWIGAINGLHILEDGIIKHFTTDSGLSSDTMVLDIEFDSEGTAWMTSFLSSRLTAYDGDSFYVYEVDCPGPFGVLKCIEIDSLDRKWITTYSGVLVIDVSLASIKEEIAQSQMKLDLKAYPNPFNSACKIETDQTANIEIYNIKGKLIEKHKSKNIIFKPDDKLPGGVYLVRVNKRDQKVTKKLIYIK